MKTLNISIDGTIKNKTRKSPRKPVPNKKYKQESIFKKVDHSKRDMKECYEYIEKSDLIHNKGRQKRKKEQNVKNTEKNEDRQDMKEGYVYVQKSDLIHNKRRQKREKERNVKNTEKNEERQEVESKSEDVQFKNQIKKITPLVNRLRKFEDVNYFESSFEESPKNIHLNGVKPKVPIYRQAFLMETKTNPKDPYALDIDIQKENREKPKRNNSGKFDKTIYDILSKIEKKEKKAVRKKVVQKSPSKYDQNINKALNRVMMKVKAHKGKDQNVINSHIVIEKSPGSLRLGQHQKTIEDVSPSGPILEKTVFGNTVGYYSEEGFLGFVNNTTFLSRSQPSIVSNVSQEISQINFNTSPQNISVFANNAEIEYHSTPNRKRSENYPINILSNISIRNNIDSSLLKTKCTTNFTEKSRNLLGSFHNSNNVLNNPSIVSTNSDCTLQNDVQLHDDLDTDDYDIDSEPDEDDEFFGFKESMERSPVNINSRRNYDLTRLPWRFQGYCRRNPHFLKIKKNGLPCNQQEMVIDYEFVKRIENLSAKNINKHPEPATRNPPIQTTMLNFVDSRREHVENPPRLSLFDYEEFDIAKPPRKPLGLIQLNQLVSTPRKVIPSDVESPNVSIISCQERNENLVNMHRKALEKKKDDEQQDLLPSVLNDKCDDVTDSDQHLFEDAEGEKNIDYSIKLPTIRYGRQRKRMCEGNNDEEKISKKKKKNMMTKTEEAEFEAWAAKLNARFEEEDRHELTIE